MRTIKPYTPYLLVALAVILSSMLIGIVGAFEKSDMGILSGFTFGGVLFSLPWLLNAWRSRKHITQSVGHTQGELLSKEVCEVKPHTSYLVIGLMLMLAPIALGIVFSTRTNDITALLPGILLGSLFSCPFIWWYQQSKYSGTGYSGDSFHPGRKDYSAAARSQSNFDETFSPVYRNFAQNIYHNRHY
ncbi:MAG: hypothetical protein IT497_03390 [Ottowia sp.]|nr:hypothetical protein [Ottowia sp.]